MAQWIALHPKASPHHLGFIADWIRESDPDDARKQLDKHYKHGGGWFPFGKGSWAWDRGRKVLTYPDDPPFPAMWMTTLRKETVYVFTNAIVLVEFGEGPDGFEVARMD